MTCLTKNWYMIWNVEHIMFATFVWIIFWYGEYEIQGKVISGLMACDICTVIRFFIFCIE
jgi:hypothetical protein